METPATPQHELLSLSKQSQTQQLQTQSPVWENVVVKQSQHPPGEANCHYSNEHTIHLSLSPQPVHLLQVQAGKTYSGLYARGDISITPVETSLFARWDRADHCLQIRILSGFVQDIARETLSADPDRLELISESKTRDLQIESIGMMMLSELNQQGSGDKLCAESLSNVLAVHLLRQYSTRKPQLKVYEGGLPKRQLLQIVDYIDEHLSQNIGLAELAQLLDISQFHFSRLFKQSVGISPYQYLLQQRIERAKQLLKQTDQPITDIALLCGFNSHSHLSKRFRQATGLTPRAYRAS